MTIFRDRLAGNIRIKKKFAPSIERIRISRNRIIAIFYMALALILLTIFLRWLEL